MSALITGLPGSGKTIFTIDRIRKLTADKKSKDGQRPIYYSGITDLTLPWTELDDATQWHTCPDGSIIIIDEAQRIFRPRAYTGSVPPHVSLVETHRHRGIDLYLITQHPTLIDKNIHRLMNEHHHLVRKFNTEWATAHEFYEVREHPDRYRVGSIENQFQYPKDVFKLYKSAELHTRKVSIPFRVKMLFVMPLLLILVAVLGWMWFQSTYGKESTRAKQDKANKSVSPAGIRTSTDAKPHLVGGAGVNYTNDYLAAFVPAVAGLAYTAPAYAKVTEVKVAPAPTGCISSESRCHCYTDQGTKLPDVTEGICRQIVANGFFVAWQEPTRNPQQNGGGVPERTRQAAPPPAVTETPPAVVMIDTPPPTRLSSAPRPQGNVPPPAAPGTGAGGSGGSTAPGTGIGRR